MDQRVSGRSAFSGPLSDHIPGLHGADFSWALGMVAGALAYWLLAARSVRAEVTG